MKWIHVQALAGDIPLVLGASVIGTPADTTRSKERRGKGQGPRVNQGENPKRTKGPRDGDPSSYPHKRAA